MATDNPIKPVQGFVLHFGYVESSAIAPLIIKHEYGGFDTVEEALHHLAFYLWEDYEENLVMEQRIQQYRNPDYLAEPSLDDFERFLADGPRAQASEGISFDSVHVNGEEWWPWERLCEIEPYLEYFWENLDCAESVLIQYLDPDRLPTERPGMAEFVNELRERQTPPTEKWALSCWEGSRYPKQFTQVRKSRAILTPP